MQLVAFGAQDVYLTPASVAVNLDNVTTSCSAGNPLTNRYQSLGMTFSGAGSIVNQCSKLVAAGAQSGTGYAAYTTPTESVNFDKTQSNMLFSLTGTPKVTIEVFMGSHMLGCETFYFENDVAWSRPILIRSDAFDRVVITNKQLSGAWAMDDLYATPTSVVPEPTTTALMTAGMLGLAVAARRRKRAV